MCVAQDSQATEDATQQEGSYELLQQQLKQANETISTVIEQPSRVQQDISQLCVTALDTTIFHLYCK